MKYRCSATILADLLKAANGGLSKTRLMYGACLSFGQAQQYVALALVKGLLRHDPSTNLYNVTEKGLNFIRVWNGLNDSCFLSNEDSEKAIAALPKTQQTSAQMNKRELNLLDSKAIVTDDLNLE